jgi:hypothetical protein
MSKPFRRRRHLKALGALFTQILHLCETAGLVKLGHVALDGTKIKANASKHKAMSYERMEKRAAELEAEVARWLEVAEASDAEEDKLHGAVPRFVQTLGEPFFTFEQPRQLPYVGFVR